jgi:hypothetical protein
LFVTAVLGADVNADTGMRDALDVLAIGFCGCFFFTSNAGVGFLCGTGGTLVPTLAIVSTDGNANSCNIKLPKAACIPPLSIGTDPGVSEP